MAMNTRRLHELFVRAKRFVRDLLKVPDPLPQPQPRDYVSDAFNLRLLEELERWASERLEWHREQNVTAAVTSFSYFCEIACFEAIVKHTRENRESLIRDMTKGSNETPKDAR